MNAPTREALIDRTPEPLSTDAMADRLPPPPEQLMGARHEPVHVPSSKLRKATSIRATSKHAALKALVDWILKHGHLDNHGHRKPDTTCAECRVLNDAIAALREENAPL